MSTAQILFEQYKVLPPKIQAELKSLILEEEETIEISVKHLKEAVKEINLLKQGKAKTRPIEDLLSEL